MIIMDDPSYYNGVHVMRCDFLFPKYLHGGLSIFVIMDATHSHISELRV